MVVACGGRATFPTSRRDHGERPRTGSWLRSVASPVRGAAGACVVTLLVLVYLLVVVCVWLRVTVPGYYPKHHRPEAEVLGRDLLLPNLRVPEERAQ